MPLKKADPNNNISTRSNMKSKYAKRLNYWLHHDNFKTLAIARTVN